MAVMEAGPVLSDREMTRIAQFVYEKSGITLHDGPSAPSWWRGCRSG